MGTYFASMKISACEVSGAVASALIHDLRVNDFTFSNFPEVILNWDTDNFFIQLQAHGACVGPVAIPHVLAKSQVIAFRSKKDASPEFFEIVQKLVVELEGAIGKAKNHGQNA